MQENFGFLHDFQRETAILNHAIHHTFINCISYTLESGSSVSVV